MDVNQANESGVTNLMTNDTPAPGTYVYKMYYTFCEDPGCGAINDYADTRREAEQNRKRHAASHAARDKARP